jgi:hypothetical protein
MLKFIAMKKAFFFENQKTIKISFMKKIMMFPKNTCSPQAMIVLIVSLLLSFSSTAQNQPYKEKEDQERTMHSGHPVIKTPMKFPGIKTEAKGNHEEYVIVEQGDVLLAYNKRNTLIHTYSSFMEDMPMKYISIDKPLLDSYVEKIFSPFFGGRSNAFSRYVSLGVSLYADIDGNIKELIVSYPKEVKIPCSAIEKLEVSVLKGDLKLEFDKSRSCFKDATWVSIEYHYEAEDLRKQGLKKK